MNNWISKYIKRDFYSLVGYVFFLCFFILSVVFYEECIIFESYAIELSYGISSRAFDIVYSIRWGIAPFRFWALIGPFIGLSLKAMFLLTSVWFIALKFAGWLLCQYYFKNPLAGLLVMISIALSLNEGFYAQVLQMYDASLYFCLLFAILQDEEHAAVIKKSWVRIILITFLLILIKGTHIVVFLISPFLLLYSAYNKFNFEKLFYLMVYGVISVLYLTVLSNWYEEDHMKMIWETLTTKNVSDMSGLVVYVFKEIISLNFFFPLVAFFLLSRLLVKKKKYLLLVATVLYCCLLLLLIILKIGGGDVAYPLSKDPNYYFQGGFYAILLLVVSLWLYETDKHTFVNSNIIKTAVVFVLLFYTSTITISGVEKKESNNYLKALMTALSQDYKEQFFIIHPNYIPYGFSKINSLVEFETMLKSNLWLNKSVILFVTPFTSPLTIEGEYPIFANHVYQLSKSGKLDSTLFHFKTMNPRHFSEEDSVYFKFNNYDYHIVEKSYMDRFNHQYGFTINEY